jgi:hypothetical protein
MGFYAKAKQHTPRLGIVKGEIGSGGPTRFAAAFAAELTHETGPWPRNPRPMACSQSGRRPDVDLGLVVGTEERGGLSDGNALWNVFPTLDGLGPARRTLPLLGT